MARRLIHAAIAGIALILLAIPLLIVALLVKLTSPGPALFRQQRVGKFGRQFRILKFRTMTDGTTSRSAITIGSDDRITPIGALLRRSKIDELPQLINVVKGDMNLVGPRPELPKYVSKYSAADRELVLSVEPGLTDFASIRYRRESEVLGAAENPAEYYERVLIPRKLRYARFYARRASIRLDFHIIGMTIRALLADAFGKSNSALPPAGTGRGRGTHPRLLRAP
jgi:lipopolysaccharide/colanic/teichoic acid biosynthesis glycosyltransferase